MSEETDEIEEVPKKCKSRIWIVLLFILLLLCSSSLVLEPVRYRVCEITSKYVCIAVRPRMADGSKYLRMTGEELKEHDPEAYKIWKKYHEPK
ncbi:MAG: hypothetical protein OEY94_07650 [Alphaproteobacteria bacterium]|nr:hypothetical protein [Alphaproteobacteria bacterium]